MLELAVIGYLVACILTAVLLLESRRPWLAILPILILLAPIWRASYVMEKEGRYLCVDGLTMKTYGQQIRIVHRDGLPVPCEESK